MRAIEKLRDRHQREIEATEAQSQLENKDKQTQMKMQMAQVVEFLNQEKEEVNRCRGLLKAKDIKIEKLEEEIAKYSKKFKGP
jgi:hypothetical protein